MSRTEKAAPSMIDVWRVALRHQEAAHAIIRRFDKMPTVGAMGNPIRWNGPLPSAFLDSKDATVVCQRFSNPLTNTHSGCQGRGVIDGAVRTLCPLCGGVGKLLSARGLAEELARFAVLFGERVPDASDAALEEHNKRRAAADQVLVDR